MPLHVYLPQDRRRALANNTPLSDRTSGAALFADISGFTPLTEALRVSLGPRRGAEELTRHLESVYTALITEVEWYRGSVIDFAGDSMMCWFDAEKDEIKNSSLRAVCCALALQQVMENFRTVALPNETTTTLSLKVAVASGEARRFVLGDPSIQRIDTLAGATISRAATAEHLAQRGDIVLDKATVSLLGETLKVKEWRKEEESSERFAVIENYVETILPAEQSSDLDISADLVKEWVNEAIRNREESFLTEFRPCVALFVRFAGIDYDSEEAEHQLDAFIRVMQKIVERYGGALLQLTIGDKGSYAYVNFGALSIHEDDARRAVKAALDIKTSSTLQLQVGISQGVMRVGAYGGQTRKTFCALGDDVNLAARLMTIAGEGEILLSGQVHKAVMNRFTFEPRAPIALKGKAEPLPVFALISERKQRAIRLQEPSYALPMVGREKELEIINSKLENALQGKSQVIGIVAEAGMGKSRLIAEVIRLANRLGVAVFGGAAESSGTSTPYLVWKPIWQAFFDIEPTAPARRQLRNLEGEIEDRAPHRLQARPLLAPILDLPIDDNDFTRALEPKDRRNALEALLEDCLKAAAKEEPILLVLEDVHWMDPLSHDLLELLARATTHLRVCFVLAYRPIEIESSFGSAPRVEALPNFSKITLNELTLDDAGQLIRAKLAQLYPEHGGRLPKKLVEQLTTKAQGNPFFIEELLNYLRDRAISAYDEQALISLELPSSLHTLILSRVDQLSEMQKVTLKVASIIGRLFPFAWLYGYYPTLGAPDAIKSDLDVLSRLDITPLDTPEPELTYLFKHIVTQEVAYESLVYATRAQLHEQLAQYLEMSDADKYLNLLTFHYGRSENVTKQREYFRKAGEAAQAAYANNAAINYYERLLGLLTEDEPARIDDLLALGQVLRRVGQWAAAESRFREALAQAERTNRLLQGRCKLALGSLMLDQENLNDALDVLEQARVRFAEADDRLGLSETLASMASVYIQQAKAHEVDLERAQAMAEESITLARSAESGRKILAKALQVLAGIAMFQDNADLQREAYEESLAIQREVGDQPGIAGALYNLGIDAYRQGDRARARALCEESLSISRQIGNKFGVLWPLSMLGWLSLAEGQLSTARKYFEECLMFASEQGSHGRLKGGYLMGLGLTAYLEGDFSAARRQLEQALEIFQEIGDKWQIPQALVHLAFTALAQADTAQVSHWLSESMTLARTLGWAPLKTSCLIAYARLAQVRGNLVSAIRMCSAIESHLEELATSLWYDDVPRHVYAHMVEELKGQLSVAQFETAWLQGQAMPLDEAMKLALEENPSHG